MPRLHWRHHYPLFPSPQVTLTHTHAHIRACCAWVPTVRCHRDLFFFLPLSNFLPRAIFWALAGAHAHFGCLHLLNSHGRLHEGLLKNQPEPFVARGEKKEKKKKACVSWSERNNKEEKQKRRFFFNGFEKWNCGRSANAPKSIHFRTINPRLGSKKRKGLWPKTFIFHSYSSPELCRWMGPFGDLESLARARWMGLWTFPRPQQQQSDVSLFERAFFFKNVA